jgi:hypothetical protein
MKALLASVCLLVTLAASSAHATLILMNDPVYGVGSIVRDTDTGLDWLKLTSSTGFSINGIQGGAGGFLTNSFQIAMLGQVETLFTHGGWNGVDDSGNAGSAGHLAFVTLMQSLFGVTGTSGAPGESTFNEGFALTELANLAARPFNTISQNGTAGRVACTTAGFNTYTTPVNDFGSCRMDYDQHFSFIGTYLFRPARISTVPEPGTLLLLAAGLAVAGWRRRIFD